MDEVKFFYGRGNIWVTCGPGALQCCLANMHFSGQTNELTKQMNIAITQIPLLHCGLDKYCTVYDRRRRLHTVSFVKATTCFERSCSMATQSGSMM